MDVFGTGRIVPSLQTGSRERLLFAGKETAGRSRKVSMWKMANVLQTQNFMAGKTKGQEKK
jgi:hypothetical protein